MATEVIDRYAVMGFPISHSRSPIIHRLFAIQTGQRMQYELLEVAPDKLEFTVGQFQRTGGKGLNITVPHKTAVISLVDQMSERALSAGAVNTLVFTDNEVFGDNTDGVGLIRDLMVNQHVQLRDANVLILGAGGATRGIVGPILSSAPASVTIANRTVDRAKELAGRLDDTDKLSICSFDDIDTDIDYQLIINATSAGLKGETPPYPGDAIREGTICYDLSYGLSPTPFCGWAAKNGARVSVMGWGMLVEQAAESFHLWRGVRPDTAPVLKQISINAS